MHETRPFQLRDEGTHIPVLATMILASAEDRVFKRAGFGQGMRYILLTNLVTMESHYTPEDWSSRTLREAHRYIERDWAILPCNGVVDVEYFLGLTNRPKDPE